jgi:hypothetical protein
VSPNHHRPGQYLAGCPLDWIAVLFYALHLPPKLHPKFLAGVKPGLQLGTPPGLELGNHKPVLVVGREPITRAKPIMVRSNRFVCAL